MQTEMGTRDDTLMLGFCIAGSGTARRYRTVRPRKVPCGTSCHDYALCSGSAEHGDASSRCAWRGRWYGNGVFWVVDQSAWFGVVGHVQAISLERVITLLIIRLADFIALLTLRVSSRWGKEGSRSWKNPES